MNGIEGRFRGDFRSKSRLRAVLEQRRAPSASPSLPSEALLLLNHSTFKPFERYSDKLLAAFALALIVLSALLRIRARHKNTSALLEVTDSKTAISSTNSTTNIENDPITADQKTLQDLQTVFPSSVIADLRVQTFWTTFEWRYDAILVAFYQWGLIPEHRFLHGNLEAIHSRLRELAYALRDKGHRYSDKLSPASEYARGFTPLGHITDMDEHESHRNEVWDTATKVCDTYNELITSARQRFSGIKVTPINQNSDPVVVLGYGSGHEYDRGGFTVENTSDHEAREVGLEESMLEGWKLDTEPFMDRLPKNSAPILLPVNLTDRHRVTEHNTIDDVLREVQADCGRVKLALVWKDLSENSYRCEVFVSTIPLRLGLLEPQISHGPIVKTMRH